MNGDKLKFLNDYENTNTQLKTVSIKAPEVEKLNRNVGGLNRLIKDYDSPPLTDEFFEMKKFLNLINSSIVEYHHVLKSFDLDSLRQLFTKIKSTFGINAKENLLEISSLIPLFVNSEIKNYNIPALKSIIDDTKQIAIVHYRWTDIELKMTEQYSNIKLLKPKELMKEAKLYDQMIFIGTPRFFQSFDNVFLAKEIYYLSYDFYRNEFKKRTIVPDNNQNNSFIYRNITVSTDE